MSAIASAVVALKALEAKSVLLMTPFDRASNEAIKAQMENLGFKMDLGPSFENRVRGLSLGMSAPVKAPYQHGESPCRRKPQTP